MEPQKNRYFAQLNLIKKSYYSDHINGIYSQSDCTVPEWGSVWKP